MTPNQNNPLFNEQVKKTLANNTESIKEIDRLLKTINEIKQKKETVFKELNITPEIQSQKISESDLSATEMKFLDIIQQTVDEGLHEKDIHTESKKISKSTTRKRRVII